MKTIWFLIGLFFSFTSAFSQINWTQQTLPSGISILITIDLPGYNNGFSGGWDFGSIDITGAGVYTTNGGDNWLNSTFPDSVRAFIHTKFFNENNGIAAAAYNYTGASAFNFKEHIKNLKEKKDFTALTYAALGYNDENTTGGIILKTTNGGANWQTISALADSFSYIYSSCFIDENTGFIIAPSDSLTYILKTTDGGINWQVKFSFPPYSSSRSIVFSNDLNGIASGFRAQGEVEDGIIAVTTDGGETWNYQFIMDSGNLASASFSDESTFYVTAQNFLSTHIYKSTDYGATWFLTSFSSSSVFLDGINFLEGTQAGLVFGSEFGGSLGPFVSKTLNGGDSWSSPQFIPNLQNYTCYRSKIIDENNIYLCGGDLSNGLILKTSNAGLPVELVSFTADVNDNDVNLKWRTATETNNKGFEIERSMVNGEWSTSGFVAGNGTTSDEQLYSFIDKNLTSGKYKYRLKQIDLDGSFEYSGIIEVEIGIPDEFSLEQNYPNPFNPVTIIKYQIAQPGFVSLKLYDLPGNEVAVLVNEFRQPGVYKVTLASGNLSSGVYYYRLQTGSKVLTRKMLLVK